ncbi:hypothetical protein FACS1894180_0990 [Bacteroidia bacterium]|nr:hypothetical protein FACS1894180_0990 [Bacteroidia bacterium]
MYITKILLAIVATLISSSAFCQNVSGIIIDDEVGNPVAYANVFLISPADSATLNMAVSDTAGHFFFNDAKINDNTILKVSCLGYFAYQQTLKSKEYSPLTIRLQPSITELNAVTVTSAASLFKMKGNILNVQVEGSVLSDVGKLPLMLQYLPFVNSRNGEIQIMGKGKLLYYINNKQERDINKINEIDAKEVKNVEVILSPNAMYDASAGAVIKIFLKSKQGDGLSGNFDTLLALADYLSETGRTNLNYRKNNTDFFGHFRFQNIRRKLDGQTETEIIDETIYKFSSQTRAANTSLSLDGNIGMNTNINANNSFGVRFEFINLPEYKQTALRKDRQYINSLLYADYEMNNQSTGIYNDAYYGNAYYNGLWWKKLTVNCNLDFERQNLGTKSEYNEIAANKIQSETANHYNLYSGKINFSYPVYKGKISGGSELVFTDYFQRYKSDYAENYAQGMENSLHQRLFSGFLSLQYPIKKFTIAGGVRYEHVKCDYFINNQRETEVSQNKGYFFPSFSVNFADNNVNIGLTYRNSIFRPAYSQLRATTEYSSPYEYVSGNPYLQPTLTHEIGASFSYKKLFLMSGYSYSKNLIYSFTKQYRNQSAIVRIAHNLPKYETFFVQASWSATVKAWNCFADFGINFPLSKLEIFDKIYDFRNPKYYLSLNNILTLPHKISLYLNASLYSSGNENVNYYKASSNVQFGLTKEIFVKNLTASIWFVDIFRTDTDNYTYNIGNISRKINSYNGSQMLMFSLSYRLNNAESRYRSSRSGLQEKQRL